MNDPLLITINKIILSLTPPLIILFQNNEESYDIGKEIFYPGIFKIDSSWNASFLECKFLFSFLKIKQSGSLFEIILYYRWRILFYIFGTYNSWMHWWGIFFNFAQVMVRMAWLQTHATKMAVVWLVHFLFTYQM